MYVQFSQNQEDLKAKETWLEHKLSVMKDTTK